jgi:hypothetical protein
MDVRELRQALVLANAFKEGDLAVGGADDELVRNEAQRLQLGLRVRDLHRQLEERRSGVALHRS